MVSKRFKEINAVIALRKRVGADSALKTLKRQTAVRGRDGQSGRSARGKCAKRKFRVLGERTRAMNVTGCHRPARYSPGGSVFALILALFALQPAGGPSVERRLTQRLSQVLVAPAAGASAQEHDRGRAPWARATVSCASSR